MKKIFASLILVFSAAFAQSGNDLLEQGKAVLLSGDKSLTTYREFQVLAFRDESGVVTDKLEAVLSINFVEKFIRLEYRRAGKLVQILQGTPNKSFNWTPETGIVDLTPLEISNLTASFSKGWYALLKGSTGWDSIRDLGASKFLDAEGRAVSVTTGDSTTDLLFGANGALIAERTFWTGLGEVFGRYTDFQLKDGLEIALHTDLFANGKRFATSDVVNFEVNPVLLGTDFAVPLY